MLKIHQILEDDGVVVFLETRGLLKQYQKAKRFLLADHLNLVDFKKREPKNEGVWYFKINDQYRAKGYFHEGGKLIIYEIDDHQH